MIAALWSGLSGGQQIVLGMACLFAAACLTAIILGGRWHDVKRDEPTPPDVQHTEDSFRAWLDNGDKS